MSSNNIQFLKIALEQRLREDGYTLQDLESGLEKGGASFLLTPETFGKLPGMATETLKGLGWLPFAAAAAGAGGVYAANRSMENDEKRLSEVKARQKAVERAIQVLQNEAATQAS